MKMGALKQKVFIAEDDVFISEQLKEILIDLGYEVAGIGYDFESSIDVLIKESVDIAILDIKMHGEDQGFRIAKYINDNFNLPFVFLTSFSDDETVSEAISYHPAGYMIKPFNERDIFSTLKLALSKVEPESPKLVIKDGRDSIPMEVKDIVWIKADDKYIEIHTVNGKYVERSSIKELLERIEGEELIRTHRSYVVNLNHVQKFTSNHILVQGETVPISRSFKEEVGRRLGV